MRKSLVFVLASLLSPATFGLPALFLTPSPVHEAAPVDLIEAEVVSPYVEVQCRWSGRGAGTVIKVGDEVLVLTAAHVVEGFDRLEGEESYIDAKGDKHAKRIKNIRVPDIIKKLGDREDRRAAEVVWYSAPEEEGGDDLALLKPTDDEGLKTARLLLTNDLKTGEDVWYIGTPAGEHGRLEKSIVSIRNRKVLGKPWTSTNGCGYFGNSGGGLYVARDGHYALAGVVCRMVQSGNPKTAILAKTPGEVKAFLDSYTRHKSEGK